MSIEKKQKNELAISTIDFSQEIGAGMEGADKDSYAIPFLRVLQKISPQCDEADSAYIEGAKGGALFNSVSGTLYDGKVGVEFLPCAFQRRFLKWAPRGIDGGGYKGELLPEEVAEMESNGQLVNVEGKLYIPLPTGEVNEKKCVHLSDTRSHFGLLLEEGKPSRVLIALSSTQVKKSKNLMSILSEAKVKTPTGLVTPPTWMNRIRITTTLESNDQGSWHGIKFESSGFIEDAALYDQGRAFYRAIHEGKIKAQFSEPEQESSEKF